MTKNQSLAFRVILLLAGAGIIVLAAYLIDGFSAGMPWEHKYLWASIVLMYLVFFVPFFFPPSVKTNAAGKISAYGILWCYIVFYMIASLIIIYFVLDGSVQKNYAIIFQAVMLFGLILCIFFSNLTSSHTAAVESEQSSSMAPIQMLRSTSAALVIKSERLGTEYDSLKKKIAAIAEDLRYLSPADSAEAHDYEQQIIIGLKELGSSGVFSGLGGNAAELNRKADDISMVIAQRKTLRKE